MDFVRLVENGTYKKEDLSKEQQHFVEGMEFVTDSVLSGEFIDEEEFMTLSPSLNKMLKEVADSVVECVREMIYVTMCEYIVCTLDSVNVERDKDEG